MSLTLVQTVPHLNSLVNRLALANPGIGCEPRRLLAPFTRIQGHTLPHWNRQPGNLFAVSKAEIADLL